MDRDRRDERAVHGGVELWLLNDEGTAIVLRCAGQAVHAAFVFTEPIEAARGALVIGVEDQLGTVEAGKLADLLILAANPLDDIENIRKIETVVYKGKAYPRREFAYQPSETGDEK